MTATTETFFEKLGETPNPKIPDTLLEKPANLPLEKGEEFTKTESVEGNEVPKFAACRVQETLCILLLHGENKCTSMSGTLAEELPTPVWKNLEEERKASKAKHSRFVRLRNISLSLSGIFLFVTILVIGINLYHLNTPKAEWAGIAASTLAATIFFLIAAIGTTVIFEAILSPHRTLYCPRPKLGPKTKEKLRSIITQGWENLYLAWPAEGRWSENGQKTALYQRTELLVIGSNKEEYAYTVAAKIQDRNQ